MRFPGSKNLRVRGRMNPPSMETIFLILSGVILFVGVIYWMWSHLQLTQKKVQLLENAVFELRAMIPGGGTAGPPHHHSSSVQSIPVVTPVVTTTYNDLADDDWEDSPGSSDSSVVREVPTISTPLDSLVAPTPATSTPELITREMEISDDLIPGGRIQLGPVVEIEEKEIVSSRPTAEEQFKQLLKSRSTASSEAPALDGMPLKELRRLGEQRGIQGSAEMRKKELLTALRSQVVSTAKPDEQRTLDLATVETEAENDDIMAPVVDLEEAEILE